MILQNLKNGKISNRKKRGKLEFQKNPGESLEKKSIEKCVKNPNSKKCGKNFEFQEKKSSKNLECENVGENLKENSGKNPNSKKKIGV